eukprot:scaffold11510_cov15-Tisochrysis_lutea.AAC.1
MRSEHAPSGENLWAWDGQAGLLCRLDSLQLHDIRSSLELCSRHFRSPEYGSSSRLGATSNDWGYSTFQDLSTSICIV